MIRRPTLLFGLSLALALGAAVLVWRDGSTEPGHNVGESAAIGGPFTLTDQDGKVQSDRNFRGRWMLVYFGYTYCPDTCPTTLQEIADAFRKLGPKGRDAVPIFVTLDPARDRPAILRKYLAAFGPEFVGLTGTPAQIASVAHAYRVYYTKHPLPGGGYSIDHASTIYLMAPDGRFASLLDDQQGSGALAKELGARL
ncbi:MAG: SCO family protein [Rhizomicrobium sp.]